MVESNGSSSNSADGGSSEMAVTVTARMPEDEVGYPVVSTESNCVVRRSTMSEVLS